MLAGELTRKHAGYRSLSLRQPPRKNRWRLCAKLSGCRAPGSGGAGSV